MDLAPMFPQGTCPQQVQDMYLAALVPSTMFQMTPKAFGGFCHELNKWWWTNASSYSLIVGQKPQSSLGAVWSILWASLAHRMASRQKQHDEWKFQWWGCSTWSFCSLPPPACWWISFHRDLWTWQALFDYWVDLASGRDLKTEAWFCLGLFEVLPHLW